MNNRQPIRIALAGASGRMGGELVRLIATQSDRHRLTGAWVGAGSHALGRDVGELAGVGSLGLTCTAVGQTEEPVDAVIDFTVPAAMHEVRQAVIEHEAAWVSGVTGLDDEAFALLDQAAQQVPVLHADNFSLGIAVLKELAVLAQQRLGDAFDIEIDEAHHRDKRDAPSGTAVMLGRALGDNDTTLRAGARKPGEIGYSVRRGGGVRGDHTVHFLGRNQRLELTHRAESRALFAEGALTAADWLANRHPGRYTLNNILTDRG